MPLRRFVPICTWTVDNVTREKDGISADAARLAEAKYRLVFDNAPDPLVVFDAVRDERRGIVDWVIREGNDAALRALGVERASFIGASLRTILGERFAAHHERWTKTLATGAATHEEEFWDGGNFVVQVQRVGPDTLMCIAWDVSAEKALRTLTEQREESDRRTNEFVGVLSHELRNPLAPMMNALFLLDHTADAERSKRAREVLGRQVHKLARLVDDLLDVTRVTQGRIALHRERIDLNDLVRTTTEDQRFLFDAAGVRLDASLADEPLFVDGDPVRLSQIVGNLLRNSSRFTSPGGHTRIVVEKDAESARAVIRVADDGVGMTAKTLRQLFTPFMQVEMPLDRAKGGLGLGLALVKGLAELHGGDVTAHSAGLGRGSEFVVRLPLALPSERHAAPPAPKAASPRRRVLVIEDNVDAAETIRDVLEIGGRDVEIAFTGTQGIEKARQFHPEIVLCDIGLPGMDGYDVARAFRADPALRGTVLVALSGYALPEDVRHAREAGFDQHLAKPPDLSRLEQLITNAGVQRPA